MKFTLAIATAIAALATSVHAHRNDEVWNKDHTCVRAYQSCTNNEDKCCPGTLCKYDSLANNPWLKFCKPCHHGDIECTGRGELEEENGPVEDSDEESDDE